MYVQVFKKIKKDFGKIPFCNGISERAPHVGTFCFPICWRCFGISLGVIILHVVYCIGLIDRNEGFAIKLVVVLGIVPCLCDYLLQYWTEYVSNNQKRFIFGLIFGISTRMICIWIFGV